MFLQLLQRNADYRPDEVAVVFGATRLTNSELLGNVERCSRGLIGLGVSPGDRVALLLDNSVEFLISFFAIAACRAVSVPLSPEFKEDELHFYLRDAGVRGLIVDAHRIDLAMRVAGSLPQQVQVIVNGAAAPGAVSLADLLSTVEEATLPATCLDDELIYIYSSGSTGRPKCAPRTVIQYWWEMDDVIEGLQLTREDKIFCMIPLFHNFGAVHCMLASVGSGASLVILDKPHPFSLHRRRALRLIQDEKITILPGVPFLFDQLGESIGDHDLSSVRICYSAAAALTRDIAEQFYSRFNVPIRNHYGCTEVGVITINLEPDLSQGIGSVGKPFPGVRVRILDDSGNALPAGEVGEVVVSSRAMTRGYRGAGEMDFPQFKGGCFHTGDLGLLDSEGRLHLRGRRSLVIDVVGQKVSPVEVEDVLAEHPGVETSIVLGVPNPDGLGELVKAYVVRDGLCGEEELLAHCRARLANYKVPSEVVFVRELPKGALGKVMRRREILDSLVSDSA